MKKFLLLTVMVFLSCLFLGSMAAAGESEVDIAEDPLSGPGSISVMTKGDIMLSFGVRARVIPTSETDWDFGFADDLDGRPLLGGALDDHFFKVHANEAGWVNENWIRTETQLYMNAMPKAKERPWTFHAALEFDRPLDVDSVDGRGGDTDISNFGLERLHGSYRLGEHLRLHAGWDLWFIPEPGLMTYGDDAPGLWLDGHYDNFDFSVAYMKLEENNWSSDIDLDLISDSKNDDRDLIAGWLNYHLSETQHLMGFAWYDRIRDTPTGSLLNSLTNTTGAVPDTDSYNVGLCYQGKVGIMNYFLEGVYQFGEAEDTGLAEDDYDINAYAFSGDIEFDLGKSVGWGFRPHLGFQYTSGDDDPADDDLEGYAPTVSGQRFGKFGGEMTIIGDGNTLLGTTIYSFLPLLYGNMAQPVITGGLTNTTPLGAGRGDNPGMTMTSLGFTMAPKKFLIFKTNVNSFWWNEDINVPSFVNPAVVTEVENDYVGTEWDAELTLATSRHSFIKLQGAVFFPGEMIEDASSARSSLMAPGDGAESDDEAYRLAMEFIWNF